jgi:nucleoside-diphosphate kinase
LKSPPRIIIKDVVMQQTLVLLKPDAVERKLVGEIISRLEKRGLKIAAMKMLWVDEALAKRHYAIHEGKSFFDELVEFITSGPIVAAVFEGKNVVTEVRSVMGATDPADAAPGTIRADLAEDIGHNLIHGSDSEETAGKEIKLFFSKAEILDY